MRQIYNRRPLTTAGFVLGVGLGGFFDGIVLHQILQWHHFVSSAYPPTTVAGLELNTLWDGLFHAAAYLVTVVGIVLMRSALQRNDVPWTPRGFWGALIAGAGAFNLADGVINHQILGIHHLREGPNALAYDIAWLIISVVVTAIGWGMLRSEPASRLEQERRVS